MKLHRITLDCFRGFPFEETLDFDGKNLLLYGENGSGKSTLFHALREFFPLSLRRRGIEELRNLFLEPVPTLTVPPTPLTPTDARVELVFGGETVVGDPNSVGTLPFQWDRNTPRHPLTGLEAQIARQLGALDYRALLETHFVQRKEESVDILTLLIEGLIGDRSNQLTQRPFREEWEEFHRLGTHDPPANSAPSRSPRDRAALNTLNQTMLQFAQGIEGELHRSPTNPAAPDGLQEKANRLLASLDPGMEIRLTFRAPVYSPARRQIVDQGAALLTATLHGLPVPNPANFLNEARLTAIGLSLYLAALKHCVPTPQPGAISVPRLLVLDDVLIGLDLSHRLPLLALLETEFADWQVLLFTHDRAWFDLARLATDPGGRWESFEMHARPANDGTQVFEAPWIHPRTTRQMHDELPSIANRHLATARQFAGTDDRTAAFHTRVAFEAKLKTYCHVNQVPVRYMIEGRRLDTGEFLRAIDAVADAAGTRAIALFQIQRIKLFRDGVLNPFSHFQPVTISPGEVNMAIQAVDELKLPNTVGNCTQQAATRLAIPNPTPAQLLDAACWIRTAFEVDLRALLVRYSGEVVYRYNWRSLTLTELWTSAQGVMNGVNSSAALGLINGLAGHPRVFFSDWRYDEVSTLTKRELDNAWAALLDPVSSLPQTLLSTFA